MSDEAYPDALPIGHRLHWYKLEHVLGQGGFGITYLARDTNLDRQVAIKEYLPADYARRDDTAQVRPRSESHAERYAWGLERFALEARTLARFDHPNIVRVHSVFEANNTAYMVMRFEDGENLASLLDRVDKVPERQLVDCLLAILDGLQLVHDAGFIHRDIKPDNIYIRRDGSPVLLDFGSARQALGQSRTMTILVAPGYAPLEQYYGDPITQGPWTDIYSLGATCYRAITGKAPVDAIARAKGVLGSTRELLQPAVEAGRGRYSARFLLAIDRALQLNERDRPQDISAWRRELLDASQPGAAALPSTAGVAADPGNVTAAIDRQLSVTSQPITPAPVPTPATSATSATPGHRAQSTPRPASSDAVAGATNPAQQAPASQRRRTSWVLGGSVAAGLLVATVVLVTRPGVEPPRQVTPNTNTTATATATETAFTPTHTPAYTPNYTPASSPTSTPVPTPSAVPGPTSAPADDAAVTVPRTAQQVMPAGGAVTPRQAAPAGTVPKPTINRPAADPPSQQAPSQRAPSQQAPSQQAPARSAATAPTSASAAGPAETAGGTAAAAPPSAEVASATAPGTSVAPSAMQLAKLNPPAVAVTAAAVASMPGTAATSIDSAAVAAAAARRRSEEQLEAADAAMRRGDHAAAIELLTPLANAGVTRAQALLGRSYEEPGGRKPNYFEAYSWYSLAARGGEPGASAQRDRAAGRMQPAEVRQAQEMVDRWKPRTAPASSANLTAH